MHEFSNEQINELQELFQKELALEVSTEEACKYAEQFINLLRATYKEAPDTLNNSPP